MESTAITLIVLGVLSLLGFQNALSLAINQRQTKKLNNSCQRVLQSNFSTIGKIPISYLATLYYGMMIGQLLQIVQSETIELKWITIGVIFASLITCFYAIILFFHLKLYCKACLRLYLINLMMGMTILNEYFQT